MTGATPNTTIKPASINADKDFFRMLRDKLDHEIETYVYEIPPTAIGNPLSHATIDAYLESMRKCLIEPRWEEVNICNTSQESWTGIDTKRSCVAMAEDQNYVLVFDPVEEQYHLAFRSEDGLGTWGIRGDAVGCFIAR